MAPSDPRLSAPREWVGPDVEWEQDRNDDCETERTEAHDEARRRESASAKLQLRKEPRQAPGQPQSRIEQNRVRDPERHVVQARFDAEAAAYENRDQNTGARDERQQSRVPEHRPRHVLEQTGVPGLTGHQPFRPDAHRSVKRDSAVISPVAARGFHPSIAQQLIATRNSLRPRIRRS